MTRASIAGIFFGHSVHKMLVVNKKFMFQRVYNNLPTSVFERVGMLRELLCVRYGHCSQTSLSMDKMDFIVEFLCLQQCLSLIHI